MLQRQIMFKQLEELQRQKKLQELNDSGQQNVINQQSLIHNKQASRAQYAPLINGTPVRDASQMFMFGSTNLGQGFQNGLPYSQAQNQILHSMSLASQPVDGTPISSTGHSFSRFSHFQGGTSESSGEQVDTISRSSMSDQFNVPYQERNMFGPVFSQGLDMGGQTGNDQQEFGRGQEQGDWPGNISEKTANINPSQDFTTLDPMEQKFLFNSDDNDLGGFGNMFEGPDNVQALPSLQSGSWSALMQSALEETSSTDTGLQEEWSGLSFQNPELSNDNQPSNFMESGKHPTPWQNNIFQNASSLNSRPEHLKISNASSSFPGLQQYPANHFQLRSDSSHESNQHSHKEAGPSGHAGEFEFGNDASNNGMEFKKGFLPDNQRQSNASEVTTFRSSDCSGMSAIMDRPGGFPVPDSSAQTSRHMLELLHKVDKFREYRHGMQSAHTESPPTSEMPKAETVDAITPSNNSSAPQYFGLRLAPPTQRLPGNYFDLSQMSQQADTSHLVPLKNQDGQRSSKFETQQPLTTLGMSQHVSNSTRQPNVWVDIPSQQNLSSMGFYKAPSGSPSTSDVANDRMETAFEAPKESDSQINVKGGNDLLEASGHVSSSQRIYVEEESFSGCAEAKPSSSSVVVHGSGSEPPAISARHHEAFGHSLKQAHLSPHGYSPLNPTYLDPSVRTAVKNERVDSDTKVPQITSMSQLTSAYENYRNLLVTPAARDNQLVKTSPNPPLQDASQLHRNSSFVQMNLASTSQHGSIWPVTGTNPYAGNQLSLPYLQHLDGPNQDLLASKSKKRKCPTYELLPWHKEATKGSSRPQDMSIAELEWAQAANRIPEKLKEEADSHPKKRIILTTQLMQVLFRPTPAAVLSDDATTCYDTATYFAARLTLGDACSLANHPHMPSDTSDSSSGKNVISKGSGDQNLSKIVEEFIDRSKKLEDELLRVENGGSILEIRMESQDLERFSVINRFAKFHSRAQMLATETASAGGASAVPKLFPQRYVTASPMPRTVPEGHNCLSL
ncbi:uncharacterized protein LOC112515784 isoform X2 [Cynara cardunculus var. scolymus]|uniref:uncharacterized protein LOC112515784 isoform X2 n=1 Tax=Cynara cardunculus var. scolymus TaxID=59895 RepID=UPI000D627DB0|nr:uncharacterized protein LOC112515784 isoform X2 [Cynara cardunculus var. scolymus]